MERKTNEQVKKLTEAWEKLGKFRYAILVALVGIIVLLIPPKTYEAENPEEIHAQEKGIEQRMEEILSEVQGAGKVSVMLTEKSEGKIEYQTDVDESHNGEQTQRRTETVFVEHEAIVKSKSAPIYLGVVIVCEGGDRPEVCYELVKAVCSLTDLTSDKVTVLKMRQ